MTPAQFKAIRKHNDLKQSELAVLLGFADANQIHRMETGRRSISPQTARLMRVLDCYYSSILMVADDCERRF